MSEIPQWRAIRDTTMPITNALVLCGAVVRHHERPGLDFEPACLSFDGTGRAVRTARSGHVRRPIFREGTEAWTRFEPWLDPLQTALGDILPAYPAVPAAL